MISYQDLSKKEIKKMKKLTQNFDKKDETFISLQTHITKLK